MKYLKNFNSWGSNPINERISFLDITLGLAILSSIFLKWDKTSDKITNQLIIDKIEKAYKTTPQTKEYEDLKKELISEIESSSKINPKIKSMMCDSLRTAKIIKGDISKIYKSGREDRGCFLNLGYPDQNFILLSDSIPNEEIKDVLSHELYHYMDHLMGRSRKPWSDINDLRKILILDVAKSEKTLRDRIIKLNGSFLSGKKSVLDQVNNDCFHQIWNSKDYLTSEVELYARFKGMKRWLLEEGQISSMNDPLQKDHIQYLAKNIQRTIDKDFFFLLYLIDVNKLDSISQIP